MAEAMLLGTPVIATNWSSNTEFMDETSACMVGYTMTVIKKREGLYKKGFSWAEPDVEQAAVFMRRLKEDKTFYEEKRGAGRLGIERMLGEKQINARWRDSLYTIK
jgi:glycosyltransferase involved in cell wall biosynthesis